MGRGSSPLENVLSGDRSGSGCNGPPTKIKELKAEKLELDGVFDPGPLHRPDPRLEQVIRTLAGMSAKVDQLADQIAELKKERS